jgi:hypothetical protein
MLPVFYLVMGLVNPFSFSAGQVQRVVLGFPPKSRREQPTFRFAVAVGLVLGIFPWLSLIPAFANFYYGHLQNLPPKDIALVAMTASLTGFLPLLVAIRAHSEGIAAHERNPASVLAGLAVYLGMLVTAAFIALSLHAPGHVIGPIGILAGNIGAIFTVLMTLRWKQPSDIPVAEVGSSDGGS